MASPSINALASSQGPDRPLEVPAQSTEEYADGHMAMTMNPQFLCAHSRGHMARSLDDDDALAPASSGVTAVAVIPSASAVAAAPSDVAAAPDVAMPSTDSGSAFAAPDPAAPDAILVWIIGSFEGSLFV